MTPAVKEWWPFIVRVAMEHDLDPRLVAGIVQVESGGDPHAMRYERGYRWTVPFVGGGTQGTETEAQKFSYGLGQIMGATAREHGFKGPWLSMLFDPPTNLQYVCKHLVWLLKRYRGDMHDAISAYNQGSARRTDRGDYVNQVYVNKVLNAMREDE